MTAAKHTQGTLGARIVRASFIVGIAHLLLKLAGLLQAKVLAQYLDQGQYDIIYAFVFENCIFAVFLIGEEVIGPTFLPVFMREMDERGEDSAWRFGSAVLSLQFLILLVTVGAMVLFPGVVIRLITDWSMVADPGKFGLARQSLVWLAPSVIFLSLGSTTYMLLNGYKRFFLAAFGDAAWKFCVFFCVLIGMGMFGLTYRTLIFGLLAGSALKLLTHLAGLLRELRLFRPALVLRTPAMRAMLLLMLPLIGGILFAKVRDIFNNVTVLSFIDTEGLMQANSIGRKLYVTIGWLVPYSISIAIFPYFCEMIDQDNREEFGNVLTHAGKMLLSVFIPFAMACIVLSEPITSFIFHGGEFTAEMVRWTSVSMACYTLVLPAYATEYLLMQAYFANRRMVSVTVIGMIFSMVSIIISYLGIAVLGARGMEALAVVASGFALSRTLKVTALVLYLKRSIPLFPAIQTASLVVRALLTGLLAAGLCYVVNQGFLDHVSDSSGKLIVLARLAVDGTAAAVGFLAGVLVFRLKEPSEMLQWGIERVRERLGG